MAAGRAGRSSLAFCDMTNGRGLPLRRLVTHAGCGGHESDGSAHLDFNNPNHSASTARSGSY